ncbi:MAG TPA: TlpA disulfide reductase family protein [Thermoanaerobaculia bacterium]|nr:TlpA disulfide reductase family protein [Thermoanaerobaculia bacterium]
MKIRVLLLIALLTISLAACRKEKKATDAPDETATQAKAGEEAPKGGSVGATLPPYKAQNLDGKEFDLASTKGTVVLLNIWATWCPPCRYEIPELIKLHETYASRGFQVIGASVDGPESMKEVAPMVQERKINYPVILDPDGKIADIFETSVLPTSALLDREGKVIWTRIGTLEADDKELVAAIEGALGK